MRSAAGPPGLAGRVQVVLGSSVAHALEGIASCGEVLHPVGDEFELSRLDLGAVLLVLEVAQVGDEAVGGAVEALCLKIHFLDSQARTGARRAA